MKKNIFLKIIAEKFGCKLQIPYFIKYKIGENFLHPDFLPRSMKLILSRFKPL
jgi:hypothetical protein